LELLVAFSLTLNPSPARRETAAVRFLKFAGG